MPDEIKTGYVVTYNSFNKIGSISETGAYRQDFTYAADEHRRVSKLYNSSGVLKKETIYVPGGYEVEKRGTNTRRLNYIPVGDCWALYTKNSSGSDSLYFILTDHLGSAHIITSSTGTVLKEMSFDSWGRRRNPNDWTYNNVPLVSITNRGFTMHEHMDQFKLINMNGRVYDPVLGQFLSPDPFVSNPASTASYNRYAYCNYNPLKYVDPSGFVKTMKGMEPVVILSTMGYVGNYSVHGGSYNPSTAALNAAFYGSHTFVSNGHGGGQWVNNNDIHTIFSNGGFNAGEIRDLAESGDISLLVDALTCIYSHNSSDYSQSVYDSDNLWMSTGEDYRTNMAGYYIVIFSGQQSQGTANSWMIASGGGDYSVWQNAAEKSGYASDVLGGLGNAVYSEYKGVKRWVGKNGNFYNSSKVRMNGGYARSAQLAKSASMTYKIAGHSMTALNVGFTAVEFAYSDKSGGDYARLVSAGIGVGLGFVPLIGPGLAIIYGIADSSGAFDGIYDYFDQ